MIHACHLDLREERVVNEILGRTGSSDLRYEQGKYFASEEPTINSVLARIRKTLKTAQVEELLEAAARKVVTGGAGLFHIDSV